MILALSIGGYMNNTNKHKEAHMQGRNAPVAWLLAVSLFLVIAVLLPPGASAEITITLKNSFIEKYKNRATIETNFTVDKAHKKPNPASKDGDLHIAGRAVEVGLPIVAEIMNAASVPEAVARIHDLEGTNEKVVMAGAWRIWTEHGGDSEQVQGRKIPPYKNANPDHVFEIHPVTQIGGLSVAETLRPIEGYKPKQAGPAFHRYEITKSQIIPGETTTTLVTNMAGYNYVEFLLQLNENPYKVSDGYLAKANAHEVDDGELVVRNRRMVFINGSAPAEAVKDLKDGDCLHVLGIPRIDLALVSWRVRNAKTRPYALHWSLPYEIIVVGLYRDNACERI